MEADMLDPITDAFRARVRDLWVDNCTREERRLVERAEMALEEAWFSANPDPNAFMQKVAEAALALEEARKRLAGACEGLKTRFSLESRFPEEFDRLPLAVPKAEDAVLDPLRALSHAGRFPDRYSVTVHKP
jgi:hypothetical protein